MIDPDGTAAILSGVRQGVAFVLLMGGGLGLVAWIFRRDVRR